MRLLRTPKVQMATVLSVLSLLTIIRFPSLELILRLVLILAATLVLEYALWRIRKVAPPVPSAGIVTALIIFLLADPAWPVWLSLVAILVSVTSKQFLRPGNHHIFNPAASGLLAASVLGLPVTWWGISWGMVPLMTTIILAGFVSLYTIRQHKIIISFLAVTLIISTLFTGPQTAINQLLVGSFWFFTLVMLPEPMTAAHFPKTKLLYGSLVALLSFVVPVLSLPLDPLLVSLLAGNVAIHLLEDSGFRE